MVDVNNKFEQCSICKKEYTSFHSEVLPGVKIYVCEKCLELAKTNFIWICMGCGKSYIRLKKAVIERIQDPDLKKAYMICEDIQIIQGIDCCISCNPEGIFEYFGDKLTKIKEC